MSKCFGTITRRDTDWYIACDPHVAVRFKRVFGKSARTERGKFRLSITPENTYELNWFTQRYPMRVEHREAWDGQILAFVEKRSMVERILDMKYQPSLFNTLALPLREYQKVAADLVLASGGLLLADDVGIGKTATAIGMISDPRARPALVVTLTHLPRQWQRELARFAPGLAVHVLKKGSVYDLERGWRGKREPFPDVIISNYHKLAGWSKALAGKVNSITFDEVQELRHDDSHKYDAASEIAHVAKFRLGLSATPIYNYGGEIFNVLESLSPGALGTKTEFGVEWCGGSAEKGIIEKPDALGSYLRDRGLLLRRTRAEVGRELPDLVKVTQMVDSDIRALDSVSGTVNELVRVILSKTGKTFDQVQARGELDWRLRQATGIAKAPFVADFVRLLVENGEQVVLYGWHHAVYSIWCDKLKDLNPVLYTGQESTAQKEAAKQAFLAGSSKVLVMSLRSGAGLDGLQEKARTVVFGELDWSPGVHEQCSGRLHRDGQTDSVVAYYMLSDEGSDPVIADVLGLKEAQAIGVRDGTAPLFEARAAGDHVKRLAEEWLKKRGGGSEEPLREVG